MMVKRKLLVLATLISLVMLFSAACETAFPEWGGQMPNETGAHEQPYSENQQMEHSQAVSPEAWLLPARSHPSVETSGNIAGWRQACEATRPLDILTIPAALAVNVSNRRHTHLLAAWIPNSLP